MTLSGHSVLIFEDDAELSGSWHQELTARGADVEVLRKRADAEQRCRDRRFDLIVSDVIVLNPDGAPVPDGGILFIGHLRAGQLANLPDWCLTVPVMAVTGAGVSVGQNARGVGADHVLLKPFPASLLAERIEAILDPADEA